MSDGIKLVQDKYINRHLRVETKDNRGFFGVLVCVDKDCDLIIQDCIEKRNDSKYHRYIGMVVVPGDKISKISLQQQ